MLCDMKSKNSFSGLVLEVVKAIPAGKVMTYAQVALSAGAVGAARAVGSILKKNFDPAIPCHRVIRSDGKIGDYNRGEAKKRELLLEEGVIIKRKTVDPLCQDGLRRLFTHRTD